ncbi:MAG: NADH oxidase [Crocinitomicaceae bacterium]|nr:NADH oxidase [Crocinitomicaceae bacterium]|tara:strand:- start:3402 stop:4424 length:1023 start_codon:yes stop_codon:yes gene_type:complete
MANIALNFEDGVTRILEGLPYETVADTAYRLGINIPLDCADGACGTCKCHVKSGQFDPGDYIEDALTDEEFEQGYGLACQMIPESDLIVEIMASSAVCKVEIEAFQATIEKLEFPSSEIVKLTLKTADNKAIDFLPGQYVNIEIPGLDTSRSYSFCNAPGTDELVFLIRLVPGGLMSTYLSEKAKEGDTLNLTGPLGSFYLREVTRPTLFFAGGTGIAPFISMLKKLEAENNTQPIALFYGATTEENLVELEQIQAYTNSLSFDVKVCVSGEETTNIPTGYVTQFINKETLTEALYDLYLCGPPPMIEAIKTSLQEAQIQYDGFYMEKFVPTGSDAASTV